MPNLPMRLCPALGDGFDADPLVHQAWLALVLFGGSELDRVSVAALLAQWQHHQHLTSNQAMAVVARFPAPTTPPIPPHVEGRRIAGQTRRI